MRPVSIAAAVIRANVHKVIQPRTNSFLFEARTDPAIMNRVRARLPLWSDVFPGTLPGRKGGNSA